MAQERPDTDPHRGCEPAAPRLLQLRPDRRLGHEWDDWDGMPLPNDGIHRESPALFFALVLTGLGAAAVVAVLALWLVAPRLASLWRPLPTMAWSALACAVAAGAGWLAAVALALRTGRNFLPSRLAERGLLARVMPMTERIARVFGISRDRAGNAALRVYNALSAARARPGVRPEQLLVLLPRCLDKASMQGAMDVSARYGVPLFVAARGRYAREMIGRVRPKAVVAVACERDLVSGIHDVAQKLPVLGTTLGLPEGPCKNTSVDFVSLERQIRAFLGIDARAG